MRTVSAVWLSTILRRYSIAWLPRTPLDVPVHIKPMVLLTADPVDVQPAKHIFTCRAL